MPSLKSLLRRISSHARGRRLLEEIEIELFDLAGQGNGALENARVLSAQLAREADDLARRAEGARRRIRACLEADRADLALSLAEELEALRAAARRMRGHEQAAERLRDRLEGIRRRRTDLARVRAERALDGLRGGLDAVWRARLAAAFEQVDVAVKQGDTESVERATVKRADEKDEAVSLSQVLDERQARARRAETFLASFDSRDADALPESRE